MLTCLLAWIGPGLHAEGIIHHGPILDIQVQRGTERLPVFRVNQLQAGDKLLVKPDLRSLAKGDWVLMLGRISPAGNQVQTRAFDLSQLEGHAELEITSSEQAPVVVLAPQLRNMFGLYTSFSESNLLLKEVIQSDPQRFYDLQKVDEVNQAITALGHGLDEVVSNRSPEQAIAAAKALAFKFGVRTVDPDCFKGNTVNTQCVAINIVANKDFVLPSSSELGMLAGSKGAADLTKFLTDKLGVFSDASDFLTHKFRDQYDFAATFGRPKANSSQTELFSLARFRSGHIKTAYVYVPAWFKGPAPTLSADASNPACFTEGHLHVKVNGRLPVVNYWHAWEMTVTAPGDSETLTRLTNVSFLPERGIFQFDTTATPWTRQPQDPAVTVHLRGRFGFDPVQLPALGMALPMTQDVSPLIEGSSSLVSGEQAQLVFNAGATAACVESMTLKTQETVWGTTLPGTPVQLALNLAQAPAGDATLQVKMKGGPAQAIALRIQQARAQINTVEHAELDEHITVTGHRLERILNLQVGQLQCMPREVMKNMTSGERLVMTCGAEVKNNASLPSTVTLQHKDNEPGAIKIKLLKTAASPRIRIAHSPNALLIRPSTKAQQWGLTPTDTLFSDDSGLSLLLQAIDGYTLVKGSYVLQLRFVDDPVTTQNPISAPLMSDFAHQELRTRAPVRFKGIDLPSVVNPLEYRVLHEQSGLFSPWAPTQRQVLMLPELTSLSCSPRSGTLWVHGSQLDLIDAAQTTRQPTTPAATLTPAVLQPCNDGLCLAVPAETGASKLAISLHWVNQRMFAVDMGPMPNCKAE